MVCREMASRLSLTRRYEMYSSELKRSSSVPWRFIWPTYDPNSTLAALAVDSDVDESAIASNA